MYVCIYIYIHHMNHMNQMNCIHDYISTMITMITCKLPLFSTKPMDVLEYQAKRVDFALILQVHPDFNDPRYLSYFTSNRISWSTNFLRFFPAINGGFTPQSLSNKDSDCSGQTQTWATLKPRIWGWAWIRYISGFLTNVKSKSAKSTIQMNEVCTTFR